MTTTEITTEITASWTKHEGEWVVVIPEELASSLSANDEVTVANRSGETKVVRVLAQIASKPWGQVWSLAPKPKQESLPEGYYFVSGDVFKVRTSKAGNAYATILTPEGNRAKWAYAPGAIKNISATDSITIDQAASFGHLHGFCALCGLTLTDPESVKRGIGPICAKKI